MSGKSDQPPEDGRSSAAEMRVVYFEFQSSGLDGQVTTLRAHRKNGDKVSLPATDMDMIHLMRILMEAYPQSATKHVASRGWKVSDPDK